jgi:hypothetical protein
VHPEHGEGFTEPVLRRGPIDCRFFTGHQRRRGQI